MYLYRNKPECNKLLSVRSKLPEEARRFLHINQSKVRINICIKSSSRTHLPSPIPAPVQLSSVQAQYYVLRRNHARG